MGYYKIYNVLILFLMFLSLVFSVSIQFQKQIPEVVLLGTDVTFIWTYDVTPDVVVFGIVQADDHTKIDIELARHVLQLTKLVSASCGQYCSLVEWTGDDANQTISFKIGNVSSVVHGKQFAVSVTSGPDLPVVNVQAKKVFISIPPVVEIVASSTNVTDGDLVTIQCKIKEGRPDPTLTWYHNGKLLEGKTERYLFDNQEIEANGDGTYKCSAKNNVGQGESAVISITVHDNLTPGPGPRESKSSKISNGAILGIVFSLLAVVIVAIIVGLLWLRHKKMKKTKSPENYADGDGDDHDHDVANGSIVGDESKRPMVARPTENDQVWL